MAGTASSHILQLAHDRACCRERSCFRERRRERDADSVLKIEFTHIQKSVSLPLAKVSQHSTSTSSEVTKPITVLHAIRWVAAAWSVVGADTTPRRNAGILTSSLEVICPVTEECGPFADLDNENEAG